MFPASWNLILACFCACKLWGSGAKMAPSSCVIMIVYFRHQHHDYRHQISRCCRRRRCRCGRPSSVPSDSGGCRSGPGRWLCGLHHPRHLAGLRATEISYRKSLMASRNSSCFVSGPRRRRGGRTGRPPDASLESLVDGRRLRLALAPPTCSNKTRGPLRR